MWFIILHSWHLLEMLAFSEFNAFHCHVHKANHNQLKPAHNYAATDPNGK
jgi:hypothetical protein